MYRRLLTVLLPIILAVPLPAQTYDYDDAGRLTSVTYANGAILNYTYDAAGNITSVGTPQDADADGMEDGWEIRFFGSIAAADPNGDRDGDGLTELAEFALGRRPDLQDAAESTVVSLGSGAGEGFLEFSYQRSKSARAFNTFTVELSRDLLNWFSGPADVEEVGSPLDLGGDLERVRFRVTMPVTAEPTLFVRLLIERKP